MLGCWDERFIDQVSDVPFFFTSKFRIKFVVVVVVVVVVAIVNNQKSRLILVNMEVLHWRV